MTATAAQTAATEQPAVLTLLAEFAAKPGCEKYAGDAKKLELVETYLWLRQLTDELTFERFLDKYAAVADHDETNRKHPADAADFHCPRRAVDATKRNVPQWSAKQAVDIAALYVDVIREAENQGQDVPLTFDQYLAMDGPAYQQGKIEPPPPAKARRAKKAPATSSNGTGTAARGATDQAATEALTGVIRNPQRPTAINQAVIYTMPNGRQFKGATTGFLEHDCRNYVSFRTYEGEDFIHCNIEHFAVIQEVPPTPPTTTERKRVDVPRVEVEKLQKLLAGTTPVPGAAIGASFYEATVEFQGGVLQVDLNVINGENGPYVESMLVKVAGDKESVICESPPRQNLLGEYRYEVDGGQIVTEVCCGE